jgi:Spy/CpxP family protein refolding chaperone
MSEANPLPSDSNSTYARRRRGFLGGLLLGTLGAGLVGFAIGATMPAAEAALGVMAHRGFGDDGPPTPEHVKEHAGYFIGFALHRLDATDEQEDKVQSILNGAIDEAFPIVQEHRANKDELRTILAGPTIDRAAIEKLRGEEIALVDSLSKTLAGAIADSAEVLTLEQRTELVERLERFHHRH